MDNIDKNIVNTNQDNKANKVTMGRFVEGYKGFNSNLTCRKYKYDLGKINYENVIPKVGEIGLHFDKTLYGCFSTYQNFDTNIFAKVYGFDKIDETIHGICSTNSLMISKILTKDEIATIVADEQIAYKIKSNREIFHIDIVKKLCTKIPNIIIGGSVGLFLQGHELDRHNTDLDLILPHWINLTEELGMPCIKTNQLNSGNDFDEQGHIDNDGMDIKYDLVVNPQSKYSTIVFEGVNIKVVDWKQTVFYKLKYAIEGNQKHINDVNKLFEK